MSDSYSQTIEDWRADQRAAAARVVGSVDLSPDDASRSLELSRVTGVPAPVIHGDLEGFERNSRAAMAGDIVRRNNYLADYMNSHPLAPQLSHDDVGNLDEASDLMSKVTKRSVLGAAMEGFKKSSGYGEEGVPWIGSWLVKDEKSIDEALAHPLAFSVLSAIGALPEAGARLLTGLAGAVGEAGGEAAAQVSGDDRHRQYGAQLGQAAVDPGIAASLGPLGFGVGIIRALSGADAIARIRLNRQLQQSVAALEPYAKAGKPPPFGIDPTIDQIKVAESEADLKKLIEVLKTSQASLTKDRDPDMYADFARQHVGDQTIGIYADALRELYGDKIPEPDDGIIGFIPNAAEKLAAAEANGGYVEVPLADFWAKFDPSVAKEVEDFIRPRPDGVSRAEAKAMVEAYHGSPHDFEAFSMEKIGTGEGAQSYGHGLYFAENEKVAEDYQRMAQRKADWTSTEPEQMPPGNKYRVRIHANKEDFLDWDKLLQDQPEILKKLAGHEVLGDTIIRAGKHTGEDLLHQIAQLLNKTKLGEGQIIERYEGFDRRSKEVSQLLAEAGIPGIKYLDQGSRGVGNMDKAGLERGIAEAKAKIAELNTVEGAEKFEAENKRVDVIKGRSIIENHLQDLEERLANWREPTHNFVVFSDSIIEITHKNDVEIVRKAAATETSTKAMAESIPPPEAQRGQIVRTVEGSEIHVVPTEKMTKAERDMAALAKQTLDRILGPDQVELMPADQIKIEGKKSVAAVNIGGTDVSLPVVAYTVGHENVPKAVRHEAIHQLMRWGLITPEEWALVKQTALAKNEKGQDWLDKHNIRERYAKYKGNEEALIEEAFAEEYGLWGAMTEKAGAQAKGYAEVVPIFEKVKAFFEDLKARIDAYFGHPVEIKDLFEKIESGEVRKRPKEGEAVPEAKASQPELPGVTRMEDRAAFEAANAIGMTVDQYKRYMRLIAQRQKEDIEATAKAALEEQRKKQTAEWKKNYADLRPQVATEFENRPDVAAHYLLSTGKLFGDDVGNVRIGEDYVTPAQRAELPKSWVTKSGGNPSDIAPLVGFPSGEALINGVIGLEAQRKASGMNRDSFFRRMVDAETERQMEAKYGKLGEQILQEAKEQVLSETQLDLLHEETLAMGLKAGTEFSITKDQMKRWTEERFMKLDAKDIDSDRFIADAGRAGRAAEDALLKKDPAEGFRQRQRQYISMLYAKAAIAFEKEQAKFEKTAERLTRRENKSIDQDFMNFSQDMLAKAGYNIKRSLNELADSLDRSGYTSFEEFIKSKNGDGWELTIDPEILAGRQKTLDKMSVEDFMNFSDALDQMYHVGRKLKKFLNERVGEDFAEWKEEVLANIRSLPVRDKNKPVRWLWRADAAMTKMEEVYKDLDLRQELGPLWKALAWPMSEAKHTEYSMLEALSKRLTELQGSKAWIKSLQDTIHQDFFTDPYDNTLFDLTREHMIGIMLNFGTRSNIEKFTKGYAGKDRAAQFEAQLRDLFDRNATKEDWDFVQGIWDIFKDWKEQSADMYYRLSGRQPKWIDDEPVNTRHGTYAGGYYPIIYDRLRSNINAIQDKVSPNALMGPNYFRASPANHYAKDRTGYVDYVQFQHTIEQVAARMQQIVHDIAYREAVMDASKVVYDRELRSAIRKHYGLEYEAQLVPWLKDIANHFNSDEVANSWASAMMRRARMNLVAHALGFNINVITSPAVAKANPMDAMRVYTDYSEASKLAYEKSREIPHTFRNIDRDFRERLEQNIAKGGWDKFQSDAVRWSFLPTVKLEQQFRIITFVNEYQKARARGMSEGEAAGWADSLVRERHGASGLPDMPAIMRGSEGMKLATLFYGYFSAMYQWQRQIPGNIRRGEWKEGMGNFWGAIVLPAAFGAVIFNNQKESDSWGKTIAKALALQPLSTVIFGRELANLFFEGNPTRSPMSTLWAALSSAYTDIKSEAKGKEPKKPIQHTGNVIGLATGLPLAQLSRTTQFISDAMRGRQRPRNILEWIRGIRTGEARLKK